MSVRILQNRKIEMNPYDDDLRMTYWRQSQQGMPPEEILEVFAQSEFDKLKEKTDQAFRDLLQRVEIENQTHADQANEVAQVMSSNDLHERGKRLEETLQERKGQLQLLSEQVNRSAQHLQEANDKRNQLQYALQQTREAMGGSKQDFHYGRQLRQVGDSMAQQFFKGKG